MRILLLLLAGEQRADGAHHLPRLSPLQVRVHVAHVEIGQQWRAWCHSILIKVSILEATLGLQQVVVDEEVPGHTHVLQEERLQRMQRQV